ncbi:hypothetical protein BSZ40_02935 [Buchananella hordeovulneris]|uniref:SSD domain-containing protein n=1 Tax=Buchananella hordeovulneris TaxID=52770 RepID=A0A1Q5PXU3_9ACTO|nr:hypothetical protein BSZ40_02935 [Buchananella hordeovulneris]
MFKALARTVVRYPRWIVTAWVVILLGALASSVLGLTGDSLFARLGPGDTFDTHSRAHAAQEVLQQAGGGQLTVTALVQGVDVSSAQAAAPIGQVLRDLETELAAIPDVVQVVSPFAFPDAVDNPAAASIVATDRQGFLVAVDIADVDEATQRTVHAEVLSVLQQIPERLAATAPAATVLLSSKTMFIDELIGQVKADLVTGEAISLPASLVVMVLVFGGFLAAGMPLLGAVSSIVSGLGAMWILSHFLTIEAYVVNVVTIIGLGLSIDYGLLLVSRYREELAARADSYLEAEARAVTNPDGVQLRRERRSPRGGNDALVADSLVAAVSTAGRTVFFSALTVALSTLALVVMRPELLRYMGFGAIATILLALAASITLVPAVLVLLGRRLAQPSVLTRLPLIRRLAATMSDVSHTEGVFSRLARQVQKRPWVYLVGSLAALAAMCVPLAQMQVKVSTEDLLPPSSPQRQFLAQVVKQYPASASTDLVLVAAGAPAASEQWVQETVARLPGVAEVLPGQQLPAHTVYGLNLTSPSGSTEADGVVRALYAANAPTEIGLTGQSAIQVEFVDALWEGFPLALALVVLSTFVLLFLLSGSLLVPVKALLTNGLSLAASLGLAALIFGRGLGEGLLGYTATGGLEATVLAVSVAFGFGLAMDYEVFLLARMREYWDQGYSNNDAVALALQRSGRIVTSAALIICVVFLGFVFGDLLVIKQVGVTLALIVIIDVTVVRMLLVPATMTLLGKWNWWAPKPLVRLYQRLGLRH